MVSGIPVLLLPERLYVDGDGPPTDVTVPPYAEAYSEVQPYSAAISQYSDSVALNAEADRLVRRKRAVDSGLGSYPEPVQLWMNPGDDFTAQLHAMNHLAPVEGNHALQIGGIGWHALSMLAAGARHAFVIAPVLDELLVCERVARDAGLSDRLDLAVGIAEELPLDDHSIDVAYSPASIHHTMTERSFPEIARVLSSQGRFASIDVFRSPLYEAGVRLFGKREADISCRPLDRDRLVPASILPGVEISFHGAFFRYFFALAARRRRPISPRWFVRLTKAEDAMARVIPGVKRLSSLVCVTADAAGGMHQASP